MPQKPQVRAKDKRRLTKRLAKWRTQKELNAPPIDPAKKPAAGAKAS
jgi:hypothetical protein